MVTCLRLLSVSLSILSINAFRLESSPPIFDLSATKFVLPGSYMQPIYADSKLLAVWRAIVVVSKISPIIKD